MADKENGGGQRSYFRLYSCLVFMDFDWSFSLCVSLSFHLQAHSLRHWPLIRSQPSLCRINSRFLHSKSFPPISLISNQISPQIESINEFHFLKKYSEILLLLENLGHILPLEILVRLQASADTVSADAGAGSNTYLSCAVV